MGAEGDNGGGRRWLLAFVAVGVLLLLLAGAPSDGASAQATTGTVTATPTFQWVVKDLKQPKNVLHVDPFQRRFQVDYVNESGTPVVGTPIAATRMQKSNRLVTFKWSDQTRICETPTPNPTPGGGPNIVPTPGRCPIFVWATLDRVRRQVRATIFRRTTRGHAVSSIVNQPTPLALPQAPDPFVAISDFRMAPRKRIVPSIDQLYFQNNTNLSCTIQFNSARPPGLGPDADSVAFDVGVIAPGQVSKPFPPLVKRSPTPTVAPDQPQPPKPDIWRAGEHLYTGSCGPNGIPLVGSIVIPG